MGEILARDAVAAKAADLRQQGKRIVTTNGCFDILHVGHIRCLKAARALGDVLILGLNSDQSVRRIKGHAQGPPRPVNCQEDRAEVLASLGCVDYVVIFTEDTPIEFIKDVRPDVHAKGGDYKAADLEETPIVEGMGGRMEIIKFVPGRSTTELLEKIQSSG
ncbi:MAG TPA: D-glycero-beta-D-manno-heptose 1-phosphate adenylyltransferase [Chroococcales cyanobacterium]